jgi:hypothetical protein
MNALLPVSEIIFLSNAFLLCVFLFHIASSQLILYMVLRNSVPFERKGD